MKKFFNILAVDDEFITRALLEKLLTREGYTVLPAQDGNEALGIYRNNDVHLVLCDVVMPGMGGIDLLKIIREDDSGLPFILLTGYSGVDDAVRAMKLGASDYITKPFDEKRILSVMNKYYLEYLDDIKIKEEEEARRGGKLDNIVGISRGIKNVISDIISVADTEISVLITGESGTGKEIAARAAHNLGPRASGPFVAVNCSAVPRDLLESEFFGYEKGAFSGADRLKPGLFELAHTGTLFLDEIGDMPLELQAKILRVMDEKKFRRVGGTKLINLDVRIISATNHDLQNDIKLKLFRQDLFYRLAGFLIHLPPLRERKDDIPLLVRYFFKIPGGDKITIPDRVLDAMCKYHWPGNIRELHHVIERMTILSNNRSIKFKHLPDDIRRNYNRNNKTADVPRAPLLSLEDLEKKHIDYVLNALNGDKKKTAKTLGIGLTTLYRKLQKYSISE